MALFAPTSTSFIPSKCPPISNSPKLLSRFTLPFTQNPTKPTAAAFRSRRPLQISNVLTNVLTSPNEKVLRESEETTFVSRFAPNEARTGGDVLVEALEREGVAVVFAYPGSATMEIHEALTRTKTIRNILPRHEQGGVFAAEGYARASGKPGVCIATSGAGVTNFVSGLADAQFDSVPIVAITGQVARHEIGTNAFQDTPVVEMTRPITKHNYLVLDVADIPRIVKEAFFIAGSGRPGPVLIDIPYDILSETVVDAPNWDEPMRLSDYESGLVTPPPPCEFLLEKIVGLIMESKKPVVYVGGGCLNSSEQLKKFVELTGIPVASTLMGLGCYPASDEELSLQMLGAYGTKHANYAVHNTDLLLAFGVRFDPFATRKLEEFAGRAKIVHIDIDPSELGKCKVADVAMCADIRPSLQALNHLLLNNTLDFSQWRQELNHHNKKPSSSFHLSYNNDAISPEYAIEVLHQLTGGKAIVTTGVGEHQMWAAQFYKFDEPRHWLTSGGLGAMGFGLPAAMGAAIARPDAVVVDIDGDGSLQMNVQELATIRAEKLPVKMMVVNNQYLGMVLQIYSNPKHSYLGNDGGDEIFPDLLKFAEGCDIAAARVWKKDDVAAAIHKMLHTPGPYLLDVIIPHQHRILPNLN